MGKHKNRLLWADRTDGILMLSVVLFHVGVVLDGNVGDSTERVQDVVGFIGEFFMSAFFLLSGLLWPAKRDLTVSLGITERLVRVAPWTLGMKRRSA